MTRELTDSDNDDLLEWSERVTDFDGDSLSVSLELDAIDDGTGWIQQDTDSSNLGWLSFTTTKDTLPDGTREAVVDVEADKTQLTAGNSYRFEAVADDGDSTSVRKFTLSVENSKPVGEKMYRIGSGSNKIYEYDLSIKWDISTTSLNRSISSQDSDPKDMFLSSDGKKMYEAGESEDKIYEYNLDTNWDISTSSFVHFFSPRESYLSALFFKPDGKKMYTSSRNYEGLNEYNLSTAWDVSTASIYNEENSYNGDVRGIFFREDGEKMYEIGAGDEKIYELNL